MKVYVVIRCMHKNPWRIKGIFKNYEDARNYINNSEYSALLDIEEYELK
jgi:hypothetical protein